MPVAAKPLFRPDVVARRVRGFVLPERVPAAQGMLRNWAALIDGAKFASYRGDAKPYQIRQFLALVEQYNLRMGGGS